jgi:precorrin-6A/cobalt-precorrin-6A reductase
MKTVLILGGTTEAAALSHALTAMPNLRTISSLAGRTRAAQDIAGEVRTGGFGGADGLAAFLRDATIDAVIDATHPFAAEITANAVHACGQTGVPLLRLDRPAWQRTEADRWISVSDMAAAARLAAGLGNRIFLATGRSGLEAFASLRDRWFLIRLIEAPQSPLPLVNYELITGRGSFSVADERALLRDYAVDVVVSKNSGGDATYGKIAAARDLGLPVVMVERPPVPEGPCVATVADTVSWCAELFG